MTAVAARCSKGWSERCAGATSTRCRCGCGGANHGQAITAIAVADATRNARARFHVVRVTAEAVTIHDDGPWDRHPTVTNDADNVVRALADALRGRRLFYYDSDGRLDEILVRNGAFAGFAPGPRP